MSKHWLIMTLLASCAVSGTAMVLIVRAPAPAKSVEYFRTHWDEVQPTIDWCNNNLAVAYTDANCQNAGMAQMRGATN